ncbi:MAG TPA: hypothetical protein VIM47_08855 [Dermatophilaceae bacterium]|jgi:hypothetical protein
MGTIGIYLKALGVVAAGVLAVVLAGTALAKAGTTPGLLKATVNGTAQTPVGVLPHAFMELATYPDSMAGEHGPDGGSKPDWVSYGPTTNLSVPAHSLVTVTIKQYDTGGTITNPWFAKVHGTVDGTVTVNGKTATQLNPDVIGHTFTIHALPTNQDPLFVSVPLPALPDEAKPAPGSDYPAPAVVTFSFVTGSAGEYVWNCEYPCGDGFYAKFGGPMSTRGYMSGTFTVT